MTLPASRPLYLIALSSVCCYWPPRITEYMELLPARCAIQRFAFLLGPVCLAAVLHNPQPRNGRAASGARGYASASACCRFRCATAGRQVWLQHQPSDQLPSCLPSLDYMVDVLPVFEMLTLLFSGTADCAKVTWTFLGLSIAECTLLAFIGFALFGLVQLLRGED